MCCRHSVCILFCFFPLSGRIHIFFRVRFHSFCALPELNKQVIALVCDFFLSSLKAVEVRSVVFFLSFGFLFLFLFLLFPWTSFSRPCGRGREGGWKVGGTGIVMVFARSY